MFRFLSKQVAWFRVLLSVLIAVGAAAYSQDANRQVFIDKDGIVRWQDNKQEVALFGVNYCLPSGYGYRAVQYAGADPKQVIDADMTHLARMGLDAIRLSFWGDWENSDKEGNLVDNVHLDLLDYVIAQASKRGIYMLLTPIVLYSPVWPEPEELNTCQGFPRFYPKSEMGTNPAAIAAQQKYLSGIMNHVNRYTKLAYKDDPAIVFVEPVNEPYHHPEKNPVEYMNSLVKAIRDTGCKKPIFFNVSQDMSISPAIRDSQVDGATFGWYPSGLVNGSSLQTNYLSRVDEYRPMFDPALKGKAKLVYEFDAADIPGSYMYPAIARTYRSAGIQFAAMFSYDPLAIASQNLEYQTHFLNLLYTPNKAISLMIAAEAFRNLPRSQSYGQYPENTKFGPVRVSYAENLSELVTEEKILYSNTTKTAPTKPEKLKHIAGCGSSPLVSYEGTGAYFLDQIEPGFWQLEIYPDAVWVRDPFGKPSRGREVSRLIWRQHKMKITLPDLGTDFVVSNAKDGVRVAEDKKGEISIAPGQYQLTRTNSPLGLPTRFNADQYVVPAQKTNPTSVRHLPPQDIVEGREFEVTAQVASDQEPKAVMLAYCRSGADAFSEIAMNKTSAFEYRAKIPAAQVKTGSLDYAISVQTEKGTQTFPSHTQKTPQQLKQTLEPVVIYTPKPNIKPQIKQWYTKDASANVVKSDNKTVLQVKTLGFEARGSVSVEIALDLNGLSDPRYEDVTFMIKARALTAETTQVQMIFTDKYKMEQTLKIPLNTQWNEYPVQLKDTCAANLVSARLTIGAWLFDSKEIVSHGFEIEHIAVRPAPNVWQVSVVPEKSPFILFDAQKDSDRLLFPNAEHKVRFIKNIVSGVTTGSSALRVEVPTFKPAPHDVSFRLIYGKEIEPRRSDLGMYTTLRIRARGATKETDCLAIALVERDGDVRGTKVPLTTEWRDIEIPLSQLSPMTITFLPRPYPTVGFDYWDQGDKTKDTPLDLKNLEALQISFGSRLFPKSTDAKHAIEIQDIRLLFGI